MMFSKVAAPVYIPTVVYKDSRGCISSNKHVQFLSLRLIMTVPGQSVSEFPEIRWKGRASIRNAAEKGEALRRSELCFSLLSDLSPNPLRKVAEPDGKGTGIL